MAIVWSLNNTGVGTPVLSAVVGSTAMYLLKNAMKTAGWTVISCGDGATYKADGTDLIVSAAVFINNGSWIVLRSPRAPNCQLLFGHKGSVADKDWCVAYSRAVGFTGGAAATYPTASDSGTVVGTLPATLAPTFTSNNAYVHIMVSDTTDNFYCIQANSPAAVVTGGLFFDRVTNGVAGDVDDAVVGTFYDNGAGDVYSNSSFYWDRDSNTRRAWYKDQATYTFKSVGLMRALTYTGNTVFPYDGTRGVGVNPADSKVDEIPAVWARNSMTGGPTGYKGVSSLFRLVGSSTVVVGDTLGTKARVVYGALRTSLPWDGATTPSL